MTDTMVVKIIKAYSKAWYRDHIGYFCSVIKLNDTHYLLAGSDFECIRISDCEIITDGNLVNKNSLWLIG